MEGITIKAIKLMLSVLILGMLVASGAGQEGADSHGQPQDGGHNNDFGHYDWLNPGGVTYSYSGWNNYPYTYPTYYYSYPWYYPTYTYPTYHYTTPVVYPTYTYNPFVYNHGPWATNLCGWTDATYYSSGCVNVPVNCDDGNPCTVDSCSPEGCVHAPVNCDDGNPCTVDSCSPEGCVHAPVNCDDGNPCTIDQCSPNGCVHALVNGNPWTIDYCPSCLTNLYPYAKYDNQQKTYPWDNKHLGVDAWYGTFWYTNVYTPKWPPFYQRNY